jgi:hypothetical protein
MAEAICTSANVSTDEPLMLTMVSPGRMSAFAAGLPGAIAPTMGASKRTPTMNATMNSASAPIRLATTPPLITTMRFQIAIVV